MQRPAIGASRNVAFGLLRLLARQVECRRNIGVELWIKGLCAPDERLDVFDG